MIRQITINDDFKQLAKLLNESYLTIAHDFGITKENCSSNNAFCREKNYGAWWEKNFFRTY